MGRSRPKKRHRSFAFSSEVAVIWWFLFFMGFGVFPIVLDWNTPLYNIIFGLSVATLILMAVWSVFVIRNAARKHADYEN